MAAGSLFTRDFLEEGITETADWRSLPDAAVNGLRDALAGTFAAFPVNAAASEAQTEQDLIFKVLEALGWTHYRTQMRAGRSDVPDMLLFADPDAKARANAETGAAAGFRHGLVVVENKRWQRPLDRIGAGDDRGDGVPSTQMLRYLSRADVHSDRRIQWGILTNGRLWRLYWQGARSRSEQFLELDLPAILGLQGFADDLFAPTSAERSHWLKVFMLMFRREAFVAERDGGRTFHQLALDEGRLWEEQVAKDLSEVVFENVFPDLMAAIATADREAPAPLTPAYLAEIRDAALTLLYRLLFLLYAEDRNLLPVRDARYDDYGLRKRVREDIRRRIDAGDPCSARVGQYYRHLSSLCRVIDEGDESIGVPPYNGGLFRRDDAAVLERIEIPDSAFAPILDRLSRRYSGDERHWINYRDLSVQQLGSIYERLLEFEPVAEPERGIALRPNIFARKGSGSYYTPDDLVRLIIERTVGPLIEERRAAFAERAEALAKDRRSKPARLAELQGLDPASAILGLKICDPAMGSGHFLVSLVDYLADGILEAVAEAEDAVKWADEDAPYVSPLTGRIADIRTRILEQARDHAWIVEESQLDDRLIVRRMILKRVVYGVDKNPMAVELAKVSLWLHTFTVGAPLSFLDHHLRCGDSLFGEWVRPVEDDLLKRGSLLIKPYVDRAKAATRAMAQIEGLTDADIAEVRHSAETFEDVRTRTEPLAGFLGFWHALRWLAPLDEPRRRAVDALLDGSFGEPVRIAAGWEEPAPPQAKEGQGSLLEFPEPEQLTIGRLSRDERQDYESLLALLTETRTLVAEERFLHWQVAFPGVWDNWESTEPSGGFDAIIGNPPWDRIKLQEVEWFAARRPAIARAPRAADRKRMIAALKEDGDPLAADYDKARDRAEAAARIARSSGDYPLLSSGDINIYALFVERAFGLIRRGGMAGLLVPSGISADKSASRFFGGIATTGRLAALFDFENKGIFPDVDSRFKFCAFVAGGPDRRFDRTDCAFFLHRVAEIAEPGRTFALAAADFRAVNPNTGTAPVFRTARDAAITTAIYGRVPVLVDRGGGEPVAAWPVQYFRMFDMTNDSSLFHSRQRLTEEGCYPVPGNRWRKGEQGFVPLYVGRMIHQFDHRAASVEVNAENLHNPALSDRVGLAQHQDPDFLPEPQFWVSDSEVVWPDGLSWLIGFRDIARATDARTVISAVVPFGGYSNKLPLLRPPPPAPEITRKIKALNPATKTSRL